MKILAYYSILSLLGLSLLLINLILYCGRMLIGTKKTRWFMEPAVYGIIHLLGFLTPLGRVGTFTFEGFRGNVPSRPRLYVANHTGLLDAPMLFPYLPEVICVFKSKLARNPFLSQIPSTIGFLANNEGLELVHGLIQEIERGNSVLIFPEGTRTKQPPLNAFKPGFAVIAIKCQVPVQTVFIDNPTGFSGKSRSIVRPPLEMPFRYHYRLGPEIMPRPGEKAREFSGRVEAYFRAELTRSVFARMEHTSPAIEVTVENGYCAGHFPGSPLVPGAAQLTWVQAFMEKMYGLGADQFTLRSMKFLQELTPGTQVNIALKKNENQVTAQVRGNDIVYSTARFQLNAPDVS